MNSDAVALLIILIVMWALFAVALYCIGSDRDEIKAEAINRGFAFYHPKTAEFTWRTKEELS